MFKRTLVVALTGTSVLVFSASAAAASLPASIAAQGNIPASPYDPSDPNVLGATFTAAAEDKKPGGRDPLDPNVVGATYTSDAGSDNSRNPFDPNVIGATFTS